MFWIIEQVLKLAELKHMFVSAKPYLKAFVIGFSTTILIWVLVQNKCSRKEPSAPQKTTFADSKDTIEKIEEMLDSATLPSLDENVRNANEAVNRAQDDESPFLCLPESTLK